jgi:hypothetical protein
VNTTGSFLIAQAAARHMLPRKFGAIVLASSTSVVGGTTGGPAGSGGPFSTKTPVMEKKDELRRRIDDAAQHIELDRIAVSPQCGFASLDTGNPISPEGQEQKLRLVVELAQEIWGEV